MARPRSEADTQKADETPTVTTETPSEADKTSGPGPYGEGGAKADEPPVRAAKPDTPIAQSLAAGAGEHTPPDPDEFDPQGRPKGEEE